MIGCMTSAFDEFPGEEVWQPKIDSQLNRAISVDG